MRIWDINPGYLNRQSLLGEHREIHGLFNIVTEGKKGYSRHPETLRWYGKVSLLKQRHDILVSEMRLRNYNHHSPMEWKSPDPTENKEEINPIMTTYIDPPHQQFTILQNKYTDREKGRIPLPVNCQFLWAQHKYSVMARDPEYYKSIGPLIAREGSPELFERLTREFVEVLALPPTEGRLMNALQHMWGYFRRFDNKEEPPKDPVPLIQAIRRLALHFDVSYLVHSTALCDLDIFAD